MKKMTHFGLASLFATLIVGLTAACNTDGPDKVVEVKFEATLTGAKEFPPVSTSASGRMDATYNKDTKILTYSITYSGLTPIAGHFHAGSNSENGPVAYSFTTLQSPITGSWTLKQAEENRLFSGLLYANLHTATNKGGEIRGQVNSVDFNKKYGTN